MGRGAQPLSRPSFHTLLGPLHSTTVSSMRVFSIFKNDHHRPTYLRMDGRTDRQSQIYLWGGETDLIFSLNILLKKNLGIRVQIPYHLSNSVINPTQRQQVGSWPAFSSHRLCSSSARSSSSAWNVRGPRRGCLNSADENRRPQGFGSARHLPILHFRRRRIRRNRK